MSKEAGKLRPSAIAMRNNLRKALLKRFMVKQEELKKERERRSMPVRIVQREIRSQGVFIDRSRQTVSSSNVKKLRESMKIAGSQQTGGNSKHISAA